MNSIPVYLFIILTTTGGDLLTDWLGDQRGLALCNLTTLKGKWLVEWMIEWFFKWKRPQFRQFRGGPIWNYNFKSNSTSTMRCQEPPPPFGMEILSIFINLSGSVKNGRLVWSHNIIHIVNNIGLWFPFMVKRVDKKKCYHGDM